jgi:hypothetical protein
MLRLTERRFRFSDLSFFNFFDLKIHGVENFSGGGRVLRGNFYILAVAGSSELSRSCLR